MAKSTEVVSRVIRSAYSPRVRVVMDMGDDGEGNPLPSRTKKEFRDECDINKIVNRFMKTGVLQHVKSFSGSYGDVSVVRDYHESMIVLQQARDAFGALPAKLRARFENDPGKFLEYATNPANVDEMIELGLAVRTKDKPGTKPVSDFVDPAVAAAGAVPAADSAGSSKGAKSSDKT